MSQSVTKCAIKRTAIKAGACILGGVFGISLLLIFSFTMGAIMETVLAIPIVRHGVPFVILTGVISVIMLGTTGVCYLVYGEYKTNHRLCESMELSHMRKESISEHDHDKK